MSRSFANLKKQSDVSSGQKWTPSQSAHSWRRNPRTDGKKLNMATRAALATSSSSALKLKPVATFANLRALAWDGDVLYASRGYELLSTRAPEFAWRTVG